jgi:hypothetical protein
LLNKGGVETSLEHIGLGREDGDGLVL